jgi:hypothetical protein
MSISSVFAAVAVRLDLVDPAYLHLQLAPGSAPPVQPPVVCALRAGYSTKENAE